MGVYICVCVCIYRYIYIYMYVYIYTYICVCAYAAQMALFYRFFYFIVLTDLRRHDSIIKTQRDERQRVAAHGPHWHRHGSGGSVSIFVGKKKSRIQSILLSFKNRRRSPFLH